MDISEIIGVAGVIIGGDYLGWHVRIDDDSENTGGYLIIVWKDDGSSGFDDWVESGDDLFQYFEEREWSIRWVNKK